MGGEGKGEEMDTSRKHDAWICECLEHWCAGETSMFGPRPVELMSMGSDVQSPPTRTVKAIRPVTCANAGGPEWEVVRARHKRVFTEGPLTADNRAQIQSKRNWAEWAKPAVERGAKLTHSWSKASLLKKLWNPLFWTARSVTMPSSLHTVKWTRGVRAEI